MDGVAAVRAALIKDAALLAMISGDNIGAGPLPLGGALPRLMLESISAVDRNLPSPGATRHVRERVQVTIMARNYPEQKAIQRAVRRAAADQLDVEVAGISNITIHTEPRGPDFMIEDPAIWCGTQDFITTYTEPR